MEDDKVLERFTALFDLVNKVHDQCKQNMTEMALIDVFAEHNSLSMAFHEDCETYLRGTDNLSAQLANILNEIHSALCCSASHIQQSAHRLRTPIIGHFMHEDARQREEGGATT